MKFWVLIIGLGYFFIKSLLIFICINNFWCLESWDPKRFYVCGFRVLQYCVLKRNGRVHFLTQLVFSKDNYNFSATEKLPSHFPKQAVRHVYFASAMSPLPEFGFTRVLKTLLELSHRTVCSRAVLLARPFKSKIAATCKEYSKGTLATVTLLGLYHAAWTLCASIDRIFRSREI